MSRDLGHRAVRGVAWLGSGQMVRLLVSFGTSVLLARMLPPSAFGLFAMTYMAAELAQLFAAFGFGSAIVQQQTSKPAVLNSCFWTNLCIGVAVALMLVLAAPALVSYFKQPEIRTLVLPLALNLVLGAAMVVPQALLTQRMQFKQITVAQSAGSLTAAVATLLLAWRGLGVWALALQPVVGNLVTGGLMFVFARWRPAVGFRFADVRSLLSFSTNLLAHNLVDLLARNLPVLIIGRLLGAAALGFYSMATGLTGAVIFQISSVIVRVLFPTLSAIKGEPQRLGEAWSKASSGIAVLAWPLMAGAIALAPDLILAVFGLAWAPSIVPFQVLCCLMAVQAVATTSSTVLMALGRSDLMLRITVVSTVAYAVALLVGCQVGLVGAATGFAVVGIASQLASTVVAAGQAKVGLRWLLASLVPWASAAVGTGIVAAMVRLTLPEWSPLARLGIGIAAGAIAYPSLLWLFARERTTALVQDVIQRMRSR